MKSKKGKDAAKFVVEHGTATLRAYAELPKWKRALLGRPVMDFGKSDADVKSNKKAVAEMVTKMLREAQIETAKLGEPIMSRHDLEYHMSCGNPTKPSVRRQRKT